MNLISHAVIAKKMCGDKLPFYKKHLVALGSVLPDLHPFTGPHRSQNLLIKIYNNQKKIENSKFLSSVRLGIMLHYICDYFCYAHNYDLEISHGKKHFNYEVELHSLLKQGYDKRLVSKLNDENLMKYIIEAKVFYDLKPSDIYRDLKYSLTIVEHAFKQLSPAI